MEDVKHKIIAVDFDGTLCENKWPEIGAPNKNLIWYLLGRQVAGAKIILWTCRKGEELEAAVEWCKEHRLWFDAVNENLPETIEFMGGDSRKIFAHEYIDDRMSASTDDYKLPFVEEHNTTRYAYMANGQAGSVEVPSDASESDIRMAILDDVYNIKYEKTEDE